MEETPRSTLLKNKLDQAPTVKLSYGDKREPEFVTRHELGDEVDAEKHIELFAKKYLANDEMSRRFIHHLFVDFFQDRVRTIGPDILESLSHTSWRRTEDYYDFFIHFSQLAASIGFPSIGMVFSKDNQSRVDKVTHRDVLDARNMLAMQIYLADIVKQLLPWKKEQLEKFNPKPLPQNIQEAEKYLERLREKYGLDPGEEVEEGHIATENVGLIRKVFGAMPNISDGRVTRPVRAINRDTVSVDQQDKTLNPDLLEHEYYHSERANHHSLYILDARQVDALIQIGTILGRLRFANNNDTYSTVGIMTSETAEEIFPDMWDTHAPVNEEQRSLIKEAFGLPYENARQLIKTEFDHDPKNP